MATELERLVVRIEADAQQLRGELRKAENSVSRSGQRMARSFRDFDKQIKRVNKSIFGLRTAIIGVGFVAVTRSVFRAGASIQRIENALFAATGGANAAGEALQFVRDQSERLGLDLETAGAAFAGLAAAAKETSLEGQGARDIFTAVSEASTVMGLSADQTQGALLAVQQIMSKGTVQAEELRGQLGERLPGAFQIAARAMNKTTQELGKMLDRGELAAEEFLPRFAAELRRTFGPGLNKAVDGAQQQLNRFNNALFDLRIEIARSGFIEALTESMRDLAEIMKDPDFQASMRNLGQLIGQGLRAAVEHGETLLRLLAALQLAGIGAGIGAVTPIPGGALAGGAIGGFAGFFSPEIIKRFSTDARAAEKTLAEISSEMERINKRILEINELTKPTTKDLTFGGEELFRLRLPDKSKTSGADLEAELDLLEQRRTNLEAQRAILIKIIKAQRDAARAAGRFGGGVAEDVTPNVVKSREAIEEFIRSLERQLAAVGLSETALEMLAAKERLLEIAKKEGIQVTEEEIQIVMGLIRQRSLEEAKTKAAADAQEKYNEKVEDAKQAILDARSETEEFADETARLIALVPILRDELGLSLAEALEVVRKNMDETARSLDILKDKEEELTDTQQRIKDGVQDLGLTFTSAFEDAVVEGEKLSDVLKALEKDIIRILLRKTVTEPLFNFLGASITGAFGIPAGATGGLIQGPGTGTSDSVPIRASTGEFLVNAEQTRKHFDILQAINENRIPRFQGGGMVPRLVSPASTVTSSMDRSVTINNLNIVARDADDVRRNLSRRQIARILSNQAQAGVS